MTSDGGLTAEELRHIGRRLARMAEEIDHAANEVEKQNDRPLAGDKARDHRAGWQAGLLPRVAEYEYRNRRRRTDLFDAKFFGEPAWDMLLDLFINRARGQTVATTSLCIASGVPPTTALRWIGILEEQGLVHRYFCERDQRLHYVELTAEGVNRIASHLHERLRQIL